MKYVLIFCTTMLLSAHAFSESTMPTLDAITPLPTGQIQAVEVKGEIFFMSQNGRFVFRGQLTDTWHKNTLDSMDEIQYAAEHINVDVMGLPLDQMNTITIAGGPQRLIVFVDPLCPHCKTFLREARRRTDRYTFKVIVVPAFGANSNVLSRALFCASDKSNALQLLLDGKLKGMPQQRHCDTKHYDLTLTVAQLFGIRQIPFFIAPDGRYKAGAGEGFWEWAQQKG